MDYLNVFGIIFGTFLLEDPTTLAVGTLIAAHQLSFTVGFTSLVLGIFLGDLGLYFTGALFKKGVLKTTKTYYRPTTFQIILARFVPGMRTVTFISSGFERYPLRKFALVSFPSSIIWTLFLLFFTKEVLGVFNYFPGWISWILGVGFLIVIVKFRAMTRALGMAVLIATLIVHHAFLRRKNRRDKLAISLSRYSQIALTILGIEVHSDLKKSETEGRLILANHMSYLDVICLSSIYPSLYVTSVEIKETPFLGLICKLCGCLFTERRRSHRESHSTDKELLEMQDELRSGLAITLFPEGTSTNGERILPFKTTLIEAAMKTNAPVLPVVIRYEEIQGKKFSQENRDIVCWYGNMTFFPHFLRLCGTGYIKVRVIPMQALLVEDYDSRKQIGAKAWELMNHTFKERV